jgi:hypothetical protein
MRSRSRSICVAAATLAAVLATVLAAGPATAPARAASIPNPCDLPGVDFVCNAAGDLAESAARAAGDFVMRGVTSWVTNAAVWVTGKVGSLIDATATPDVQAGWFVGQYRSMIAVAGLLALPMLLLALIQAVWRQDLWILLRSALGYLPMAFILAGAAIVATQLLVSVTDGLSATVVQGLGGGSGNLLQSVGDAYKNALDDTSAGAIPLFGVFLGAIILAIGAFMLWVEMVIRDAAIYVALFFLPLTFVAMIWPATSRWARRLVEFLVAVILAKFVIVAILGLASAAITQTSLAQPGDGSVFERMIAGAALLVLAAWSPFGLVRLVPMMEVAAGSVAGQRAALSGAAESAGIHSPASYMRQAMDRQSRASTSPAYSGVPRTVYAPPTTSGGETAASQTTSSEYSSARADAASAGASRATNVRSESQGPPPPGESDPSRWAQSRNDSGSPPNRSTPPSPPPAGPGPAPPPPPRQQSPRPPREGE